MQPIPRIEAPEQATFLREYVERRRPVVLTGAMKDWKAVARWTPEYLKTALPGQKVRTARSSPASARTTPWRPSSSRAR